MDIVKCRYALFMTVILYLCSEAAAYETRQIREELQTLKEDMSCIREDITTLFDRTNQHNTSAVEACVSVNKTIRQPVTNHDGGHDVAEVNDNNVLVKYDNLIKAFVTEKKINRELQDLISASERLAFDRDRELQNRLQSVEDIVSASENEANERDRELLRSIKDIISESEKVAKERDQEVYSRLQLIEDIISASEKLVNERNRKAQDQLRSMRESIENLQTNVTSFMTTISDKIEKHFLQAELSSIPVVNTTCKDVPKTGVYTVYLQLLMSNVTVYCDQDTDGGGWLVFMRRQDGSVDFFRSWLDYKLGFGSPDGEFWAGNELLHKLTKARPLQLRIDMEDFDGNTRFAEYEEFQVGAEEDKYRLHVRDYSGTAGDSLIDTRHPTRKHAGMQFSTFDSDNDKFHNNCAMNHQGGWWYNSCFDANLNGPYSNDKRTYWRGIIWYSWLGGNGYLKRVEMKIR